ncbi:MAG: BamA/TamA family outer membrane protein, partial [Dysgonamonadaceae bacterium]|nr:BamA/TamA family outer membrane protein [Dysgonamonadaceae bacterium]
MKTMNKNPRSILLLFLLFLYSCSTTKYIPEGQYLLDKVSLQMEDNEIAKTSLLPYIQQNPNTPKWGLKIYNLVNNDSNFIKKFIRKIGEPPVIFNNSLTNLSVNELTIELMNRGYLNAEVSAQVDTTNKKAEVTYKILHNEPYRIRNYTNKIPQHLFNRQPNGTDNQRKVRGFLNRIFRQNQQVAKGRKESRQREGQITEGAIFDMNTLEGERTRMSSLLRNQGYYTTTRNNLHYLADTALQSNQVDLTLVLLDTLSAVPYTVERVNIYSGYDPLFKEDYKIVDSVDYKDIHIYYDRLHFLRPSVINEKTLVRPGDLFKERTGESMLSQFRALDCVSMVDLQYMQGNYPDSTLLDCNIYLTPGNIHSLQTGLEGTNNAGDIGVALDVTYGHLNLFNGSELFNLNVRSAYEFVSGSSDENEINHNYYELNIRPSLTFPKFHLPFIGTYVNERFNSQTQYSLGYAIQNRPSYTRNFFNFNWKIRWTSQTQLITHSLSLLDVNYISMHQESESFRDYLNSRVDPLTRYSYDDVFTAGIDYNLIYTNTNVGRMRQHLYTLRFNAESSGNAMAGLFHAAHAQKNADGQYTLFGNPFAQYVKGDFDIAHTFHLDSKNALAFHAGVGVAYPYGNSTILPFEKRYYAGGPNSVRGWSTRYLGPGSYNQGLAGDPTTHVGDITFIASAEYRFKLLSWLEPALFIDCGNIWTIKDYTNQPGGYFRW